MATTFAPPAVMPGTPTPRPNVESANSYWLDGQIDKWNEQAYANWQAAVAETQAYINDGTSGWFAKASAAVAAGQSLPPLPTVPTMTWSYGDGSGNYDQQTITPQATLTVPVINPPTTNPNPGVIANGNVQAANTQNAQMQYITATVAQIAADLAVIKSHMGI